MLNPKKFVSIFDLFVDRGNWLAEIIKYSESHFIFADYCMQMLYT